MLDRDISNMMMTPFSGIQNDQFGKERNARLPLLLDRVMEGRPHKSESRLLQLPAELLGDIADLLANDKRTLASLALVNSDCRQLARSCQFAEFCFDYSPQAIGLLHKLLNECLERQNSSRSPTIGSCIRRVIIAADVQWMARRNEKLYESIWGETSSQFTREERELLREEGSKQYEAYRNYVLQVISGAMPNLEYVGWYDRYLVYEDFFALLSRSSAQHLILHRVPLNQPYILEPPVTPATWPLRSLSLNVREAFRFEDDAQTAPEEPLMGGQSQDTPRSMSLFYATLFQRCAPTLEFLKWSDLSPGLGETHFSFGDTRISFPRLRTADLLYQSKLDKTVFASFLDAPLRHLCLPNHFDVDQLMEPLATCGTLHHLETLLFPQINSGENASLLQPFLARHPHINKLTMGESGEARGDDQFLSSQIIPLLRPDTFGNLRSLSLAFGDGSYSAERGPRSTTIPESSLEAIGKLVSLEQLCLSAGIRTGWRTQWLINHDILRKYLVGLTKLKKLAFSRDTYSPNPIFAMLDEVDGYYSMRNVGREQKAAARARPELDDSHDGLAGDEIWERAHRNLMLDEADKYAALLPDLEWILCGQRPMGVRRSLGGGGPARAFPLTKERDECYTFLQRTFGIDSPVD
ncbi:hypothetical protein DL764_003881 [Monosporascus ibericus]|uniref:F-box domain-containing protein n=1 Tax=Monosporascus ibericus TaxID=155417 RepID=A0A4Q4TEU7_9PEZI|nr:hypothetical protein DL764_003881 [Monosporascus ibericus]